MPAKRFIMAWRSSGESNTDLIEQLTQYGIVKSHNVIVSMKATDRKFYCNLSPYVDAPQRIGYSATISAPHMHAYALELLKDLITPSSKVLDVGAGSGYLTAVFSRYQNLQSDVGEGIVIGIEHHPKLVELAIKNLNQDDPTLLSSGKVIIIQGDGREGYKANAPYDVIHVGAAAIELPDELINQLKPGGRMICPVSLRNSYLI